MKLTSQQLKKIIPYKASRKYFGEWQPNMIDDAFRNTSGGTRSEDLFVGELTEDIICDVLWYEMSYNPLRFGSFSPFKKDGKNSILHFLDTYRKLAPREPNGLLAHGVITLVWQIGDFIKSLKKAKLYEGFAKNGKLPPVLSVLGTDENYYVLTYLRKAIHTIANQNKADLKDPAYREYIEEIAAQRHPTGNRSDISYMSVKLENVIQQKIATMETKTVETKSPETKTMETKKAEPQIQSKQEVIQTCLPFFEEEKIDDMAIIREKIIQKQNEIATIEQNIKDMREMGYVDLEELHRKLKHAKHQYAGLCTQEMRLSKKAQNEKSNEKSR